MACPGKRPIQPGRDAFQLRYELCLTVLEPRATSARLSGRVRSCLRSSSREKGIRNGRMPCHGLFTCGHLWLPGSQHPRAWLPKACNHGRERARGGNVSSIQTVATAAHQPATFAGVAQSVEHLFCKQAVRGSSPLPSSNPLAARRISQQVPIPNRSDIRAALSNPTLSSSAVATRGWGEQKSSGGFPEWPMGAGCKPAGFCLRWFESNTLH